MVKTCDFGLFFIFLNIEQNYLTEMKSRIILTFVIIPILILSACEKERGKEIDSDVEISFSTSFYASAVPSKAGLYDNSNIITDNEGNFSVISYNSKTGTKHLENVEWVYYMYYPDAPEASGWRFRHDNVLYERYWPQTYGLDFFAYMPHDLANSNVTIDLDYRTFSCNLPLGKDGQDSTQEFIYAYETDQTAETDNGNVNLKFKHPFAAVIFMLGEAHGNTSIHNVGLDNIHYKETFDIRNGAWSLSGETGKLSISVGRTVGVAGDTGIQLNSIIGGPYLVIPQDTDGIKISCSFKWNSPEATEIEKVLGEGEWQPGYIYTYVLNLGDTEENMLAGVSIKPWDVIGHKNEIEVE